MEVSYRKSSDTHNGPMALTDAAFVPSIDEKGIPKDSPPPMMWPSADAKNQLLVNSQKMPAPVFQHRGSSSLKVPPTHDHLEIRMTFSIHAKTHRFGFAALAVLGDMFARDVQRYGP